MDAEASDLLKRARRARAESLFERSTLSASRSVETRTPQTRRVLASAAQGR